MNVNLSHKDVVDLSVDHIVQMLQTDIDHGLSSMEAQARVGFWGLNLIPETQPSVFSKFIVHFWGPSAWLIEGILSVSFVLGRHADIVIALGLLLTNAIISFSQELHASQVVRMLKSKLEIKARVLRDSHWCTMSAKHLVPGDIVKLTLGNFVPADIKVVSGDTSVDQSALTGESREIRLKSGDQIYSASMIRRGDVIGVVTFTGSHTFYGRTVELLESSKPKLHMEEVVSKLVRWLFAIVASVVIVVVIVAIARGGKMEDILPLSLVLMMGAVPIALPVMFTVSTALGARTLGRHGVLVTRLSATEDAATMNTLFMDKTGTITLNQITVGGFYPEEGYDADDILLFAALASDPASIDSIDSAILSTAAGIDSVLNNYRRTTFEPFDPKLRKTQATINGPDGDFQVSKGAVKTILEGVKLTSAREKEVLEHVETLAHQGYRVLGVSRTIGSEVTFMGLIVLRDPPRSDSKDLIKSLRDLGVSVKMLTGDALPVAKNVAHDVGLGDVASAGTIDLNKSDWLKTYDGLAGTFPEDKLRVVKAAQLSGSIIGMTGDGVNDAPALQAAEVGIAVKGATDAAKAAASVILTESGLVGIVSLVENGRAVYQRILTWVINKISRTALKTGFVGLIYIFTGHLLVSALGMLVLSFITDFVKIALATDHVRPSKKPDTWDIKNLTNVAMVLGFCMLIESIGLLWIGVEFFGISIDSGECKNFSFLILLYMGLFSILTFRERDEFWKSIPSNPLILAMALDILGGLIVGYFGVGDLAPLTWGPIGTAFFGCLLLSLGVNDLIKMRLIHRTPRGPKTLK